MELSEYQLTEDDEKWCARWLKRYTYVIACLTNENDFSEFAIGKLIIYESLHEQRLDLLNRMMARFSKLRRKREWSELLEGVKVMRRIRNEEKQTERKGHRSLPV